MSFVNKSCDTHKKSIQRGCVKAMRYIYLNNTLQIPYVYQVKY